MNFYNEEKIYHLEQEIKQKIEECRVMRKFNPVEYTQKKTQVINQYMHDYGLKTCIIAVSGGIDSAVAYALLHLAKKDIKSPIENIVPIFLPVYRSEGATNQENAKKKVEELVAKFSDKPLIEIDLSSVHKLLKNVVDQATGKNGEAWASGQLVSYLRTPTYYYVTSLFSQEQKKPIVCGTTNRDEGAYLGYFGKASDGMVDVQIISDIHKSEVASLAKFLKVPSSIQQAIPTGDMYDNRSDEEVFGAPYDFVEFYLYFLNLSEDKKEEIIQSFDEKAKQQFLRLQENLENLHRYNQHKYLGASPAVHFDVFPSFVRGGWKYNVYQGGLNL